MTALLRNQRGQTAVEYVLMLAIVVAMMVAVLAQIKSRFLAESGQCDGPNSNTSIICQVKNLWSTDGSYRLFTLRGH